MCSHPFALKKLRSRLVQEYEMSVDEIKAALLDSFWGTERGLSASADVRADINELITQLEAKTPVENPTQVGTQASSAHSCLLCSMHTQSQIGSKVEHRVNLHM
jgi:hypothetical protein